MGTPAVANDPNQFTNNERQPTEDERIREQADQKLIDRMQKRSTTFRSLETGEEIELSIPLIKTVCAHPTRNGDLPDDRTCFEFMKLCEARKLNPFVGDAYLIGYITKMKQPNGQYKFVPAFNLIVAHSALLKRAEASGHYQGMKSGVIIVETETGEIKELPGDFYLPDRHELVGGWAQIKRDDREFDEFDRLNLSVYNTDMSRWKKDPAGMIVKCAEASVLRRAFPGETAGMYIAEEMESVQQRQEPAKREFDVQDIDDTEDRLKRNGSMVDEVHEDESSQAPAEDVDESVQAPPEASEPEVEPKQDEAEEKPTAAESSNGNGQGELFEQEQDDAQPEPEQAAQPSNELEEDLNAYHAAIGNEKQIRKIRVLCSEFKENHNLTAEQIAEVEQASNERQSEIRKALAR